MSENLCEVCAKNPQEKEIIAAEKDGCVIFICQECNRKKIVKDIYNCHWNLETNRHSFFKEAIK